MPDAAGFRQDVPDQPTGQHGADPGRFSSTHSLRAIARVLVRRRRTVMAIEGGLLLLCLLYCLLAPNQYEAQARVELRTTPASSLNLEGPEPLVSASILSAPTALETLAAVLRSDQLAWRVITDLRLDQAPGFRGSFARRFPGFRPEAPSPPAQAWLLERFEDRLHVQTLPRTMLVQVRFRCRDAALSAAVVNRLIRAYDEQQNREQIASTAAASGWLDGQLKQLRRQVERDQQRLADFQRQHGLLNTPETLANGRPGESNHNATLLEIDELGRQLVTATTDRILREAEYRAASQGDPELVLAGDPHLQAETGGFSTALLQQIRARRSDLEQEKALLSAEHGPSFPRVVEIGRQLQDLDRQKQAEDARLVARFRSNWQTALDREQLVRKSLNETTLAGMQLNQADTEYVVMRQEANASQELYARVLEKVEEAGLAAGVHRSNITLVDAARQPVKPVRPDPPLDFAITFFVGLWLALGGAFLMESLDASRACVALLLFAVAVAGVPGRAQAPTPSTSGLPAGVAHIPQSEETRSHPNPQQAPAVWNQTAGESPAGGLPAASTAAPLPGPIGPGDVMEIGESHTPEFHSTVRVSSAGTITLPMIGEVKVSGLDEPAAARAIEAALQARGMLLHPLVSVLVTASADQNVSVLGEVARPGVYPYTFHHRLLDLLAAASGLSSNSGRLVNIFHSNDPKTPHPVVLDPSGTDTGADHNPELSPGDTVQVSRAGLIYVVGDVIRPGGFPVDPAQGLTVVQALSLAWGPSQNAAATRAVLVREQKGGRTLTTLNLKRMLRGQDPDLPVHDRDILYVPDSVARNLWNRSLESMIQSTVGVTIYSALVYSQRY